MDYQPQPGTKIRCINSNGFNCLTKYKTCEVVSFEESENWLEFQFWFIDDDGDMMFSSPSHEEFEIVEE